MGVMPYNIRQCRGKDRDGYLPSPFLGDIDPSINR